MTPPPKTLQILEIEPPQVLAEALSGDFLAQLRLNSPPAVRISSGLTKFVGYCQDIDYTEEGEIVIADWRSTRESWSPRNWIRGVYVHETCHRLLCHVAVASHGLEFFTLQLLLFFRSGVKEETFMPWWQSAELYDLQNCFCSDEITSPGQCLDWAWRTAQKFAPEDIAAEAAAEEICRLAANWREKLASRRRELAARREEQRQNQQKKEWADTQKMVFLLAGGVFAGMFFLLLWFLNFARVL